MSEFITLTIEGQSVKVPASFADLSPELQNKTVDEIAASPSFSRLKSTQDGLGGQFNRGIASGFDSLVGLVNKPINATARWVGKNITNSDAAQLGETPVADLMRGNIQYAENPPETNAGALMEGLGEGASYLLPGALGARALRAGKGVVGGIAGMMDDALVNAPKMFMGSELAAGAGANLGAHLSQESDNPLVRLMAELGGGIAGGMTPSAAMLTPGLNAMRSIPRIIKREFAPFTRGGAEELARDRLQGLSADPQGQADMIDPNSSLTGPQQTGDPNIMALENTMIERNPSMRPAFEARTDASARDLDMQAREGTGPVAAAKSFFETKTAELVKSLRLKISEASKAAQAKVAALDPKRGKSDNSAIVRGELEKAFDAARAEESVLWGRIPQDVTAPTSNARAALKAALDETGPISADAIPSKAASWLAPKGAKGKQWLTDKKIGLNMSVRDLHRLYSEMRQAAREALGRQVPDEFMARQANRIADAILEDFGATGPIKTEIGALLNEARAYTRAMNETFGQGTVGKLLASTRAGGETVDPALTLGASVGRGGTTGAVGAADIRAAAGSSVDEPIQDFMLNQLRDKGTFSQTQADGFLRSNPELLDQYPQLRTQVEGARDAVVGAKATETRVGTRADALEDPKLSTGKAFTTAKPGKEFSDAVFGAENPVRAARELANRAAKDTTGKALAGLKGGAFDYLMGRAVSGYRASGDRMISGNNMNGLLQDRQTRAALAQIYSPDELKNLDRVAKEFQKLEMSGKAGTLDDTLGTGPNTILAFAARIIGARSGAKLAQGIPGGALQTAAEGSKRFSAILKAINGGRAEALLRHAVLEDPVLLKQLLTPMNTTARIAKAESMLGAWLLGQGAAMNEGEKE